MGRLSLPTPHQTGKNVLGVVDVAVAVHVGADPQLECASRPDLIARLVKAKDRRLPESLLAALARLVAHADVEREGDHRVELVLRDSLQCLLNPRRPFDQIIVRHLGVRLARQRVTSPDALRVPTSRPADPPGHAPRLPYGPQEGGNRCPLHLARSLRHTAASWLRQRKVPLDIVQKILGHVEIKSTMRYAHIGEQSHVNAVTELGDLLGAGEAREMVASDLGEVSAELVIRRGARC